MCGIAGYICFDKHRPSLDEVISLHVSIQHRGMEAAGVGFLDDSGEFAMIKGPLKAEELHKRSQMGKFLSEVPSHLLMHTRMPTKGEPEVNANNHPIEYKDWMVVHNGHIRNDDGIFSHYRKDRFAEVDSAAIALILGEEENYLDALARITGSWAIAALHRNPLRLVIARENNPVAIGLDMKRGILFWASEMRSLADVFNSEGRVFSYHGFTFRRETQWRFWEVARDTAYEVTLEGLIDKHEVKWDYSKAPSVVVARDLTQHRETREWFSNEKNVHRRHGDARAAREADSLVFVPPQNRIVNERGKVTHVKCPRARCEAITSALWLMKRDYMCPHCECKLKGWCSETDNRGD